MIEAVQKRKDELMMPINEQTETLQDRGIRFHSIVEMTREEIESKTAHLDSFLNRVRAAFVAVLLRYVPLYDSVAKTKGDCQTAAYRV